MLLLRDPSKDAQRGGRLRLSRWVPLRGGHDKGNSSRQQLHVQGGETGGVAVHLDRDLLGGGDTDAFALDVDDAFEAGVFFLRTEGVLAAPEATHAIRAAVDEAVRCRETGEERTILFGLTGHGNFDLGAYQRFAAGTLPDDSVSEESLAVGLASIPELPGVQ